MPISPQFTKCLFEPEDLVEVRLLPSKVSRFARASKLHLLDPYLAEQNAAGQNIYVGANPRIREGGKTSDVSHARCLFVDIDHATVQEALRRVREACLPTPTCTLNSGHGVHLYWRLAEPGNDLEAWTQAQKAVIAALGSDKAIHDPSRIMRLPEFMNCKNSPVPCKVAEADPDRRYCLKDLVCDRQDVAEKQSLRSHDSKYL